MPQWALKSKRDRKSVERKTKIEYPKNITPEIIEQVYDFIYKDPNLIKRCVTSCFTYI